MANAYELVSGKTTTSKGQAKMVFEIFRRENRPLTVAEVTPLLRDFPGFSTQQTPLRIAAYYVCVFHKDGTLRKAEPRPAEALGSAADEAAWAANGL